MCGIIGFNWDDLSLLKKAMSSMHHRGPDQQGTFADKYVSLGHKRLSIIDLSERGKQPIFNENRDMCIIFGGEIFNYKEIRQDLQSKKHRFESDTDTEVILHSYEEYGDNCVKLFNGFFSFAIYDSGKKRLFLARDRLGIKPLYYYLKDGIFMFASEIKAIMENREIERKVNKNAFRRYVSLGYASGRETIFESIFRLLPGHTMQFDLKNSEMKSTRYWDISTVIEKKSTIYYEKQLESLLKDSVEKRLVSERPAGIFLSGGIDSGSILALVHNIRKLNSDSSKIQTYSVGFGHSEDEINFAEKTAEHFSTNHKSFQLDAGIINSLPDVVWHSDEPISDPAFIPIKILSEKAKDTSTVILTGDGSDEIFAGYEQYKFLTHMDRIKWLPFHRTMLSSFKFMPYTLLNGFFKYSKAIGEEGKKRALSVIKSLDDRPKSYLEFVSIFNKLEAEDIIQENSSYDLALEFRQYFSNTAPHLNQLQEADVKTLLPDQFLMKNDKMCMAHSLEARVPFLDYRIVELSFKMQPSLRLHNFREKYILRRAMKKYLPHDTIKRKKQRFYVTMDEWMTRDLKSFFHGLGNGSGYFKQKGIEKIMERYNNSPLFYGRQLWSVLTFELWHKIYIRQEKINTLI